MTERKIELEEVKGVSLWLDAWRRLKKNKMAVFGAIVVIILALISLFAYQIAPYPYEEINMPHQFEKPNFYNFPFVTKIHKNDLKHTLEFMDYIYKSDDPISSYIKTNYKEIEQYIISSLPLIEKYRKYDKIKIPEKKIKNKINAEFSYLLNKYILKDKNFYNFIVSNIGKKDFYLYKFNEKRLIEDLSYKFRRLNKKYEKNLTFFAIQKLNRTILEDIYPEYISMGTFLGTDALGRDLLSRIIYGGRVSLTVGVVTAFISFVIGVIYGAISGFAGGKIDNLMMRIVDIFYGLPYMFIVILLMVIFGRNYMMLFIGIAIVSWMGIARITRGQIISLKNNEYIEAAKTIGASKFRIITRHLIPNALGPIIVYITLTIPQVMLSEAFLSFLGLGVQPPQTSWGLLANEGAKAISNYAYLIIYPGIVLTICLFSLNFLGEGLRDALDPSLKNKI
ncbi:MAG: ABC transporter permease [Spirochaetes bacterium]|nr:ABC transporter permease [Spirochaetota bacterium]